MGNLTLNLGMRFENEVIPSFRTDLAENAVEFGFGDKIAPRIGARLRRVRQRADEDLRRAMAGTTTGRSTSCRAARSAATSGRSTTARWTIRTGIQHRQPEQHAGTGSVGQRVGVPRSPRAELRDRRSGPQADEPGQLQPGHRVPDSVARRVFAINYVHNNLVRTIEDIGLLVDGDEVYLYANPGEGLATDALVSTATPPFQVPKAKRQYDAVQLELNRRFADNWFMGGSYVWSKLHGNYPGIASSDEIRTPTLGLVYGADQQQAGLSFRPGGNVNRAWDLDESTWDAKGNLDPQGPLATDRPHVFKLYGAYSFPFGTQIGANFYAGSGTPLTTYVNTLNGIEVFVEGRGDMGRTDLLNYTDLLLSQEVRMGATQRLRFELNVLNVFNQKTVTAPVQLSEPDPCGGRD